MKIEIKERIEKIKNKEIPEGYRKTNIGIYPSFWQIKRINQISEKIRETSIKENLPILTISAGNGFLDQKERFNKIIAGKSLEKYTYLKKDDFSYNRGNSKSYKYGCLYKLEKNEEALVPNVYHSFRLKEVNTDYYKYLFESKFLDRQLRTLISSTARMDGLLNINRDEFMNLKLPVPPIEEQVKISTILSKWDEGISNQEKLIEAKKEYKKGMMQKIFSQKLRFKDENGNDYPEWEEKKLGEVLIKNSIKNKDEKILRVQSISNKVGFVEQEELFQDRIIASSNKRNYYIIQKGMFAYNPSRIDVGSLAYKTDEFPAVISPLYVSFKANQEYLFDRFLLNWFKENEFKKQMYSLFEGSVRNTLSYDALSKVHIMIPCLSEQIKISNVFLILDKEIELLEKELSVLKSEKQSLMSMLLNGVVRTV